MKLADKTQLAFVVTREGEDGTIIPCAVFADMVTGQDTCDAYNQKFLDDGIKGYVFKLHCTAFYD